LQFLSDVEISLNENESFCKIVGENIFLIFVKNFACLLVRGG